MFVTERSDGHFAIVSDAYMFMLVLFCASCLADFFFYLHALISKINHRETVLDKGFIKGDPFQNHFIFQRIFHVN